MKEQVKQIEKLKKALRETQESLNWMLKFNPNTFEANFMIGRKGEEIFWLKLRIKTLEWDLLRSDFKHKSSSSFRLIFGTRCEPIQK